VRISILPTTASESSGLGLRILFEERGDMPRVTSGQPCTAVRSRKSIRASGWSHRKPSYLQDLVVGLQLTSKRTQTSQGEVMLAFTLMARSYFKTLRKTIMKQAI
jgi:hypothetical protein